MISGLCCFTFAGHMSQVSIPVYFHSAIDQPGWKTLDSQYLTLSSMFFPPRLYETSALLARPRYFYCDSTVHKPHCLKRQGKNTSSPRTVLTPLLVFSHVKCTVNGPHCHIVPITSLTDRPNSPEGARTLSKSENAKLIHVASGCRSWLP